VGRMAHVQLLLSPTIAMDSLTSVDHCYCEARGTCVDATGTDISDGPSDITEPLLLPPTVATGDMTSDDHCYHWTRGMHAVAPSAHSSDRIYDIR
jgi:hypothetical protein